MEAGGVGDWRQLVFIFSELWRGPMSLARGTKSQTASESLVANADLGIVHKNKADIVTRGILAQSISMCLRLFYGGGGGLMGCSPKLSRLCSCRQAYAIFLNV